MDGELFAMLQQEPKTALKNDYGALQFGGSVTAKATNIWWGEASFGALMTEQGKLLRTVKVPVMSYQEAGEL